MGFPITRDDLLALLARTMDPGWLDPLLEDQASSEVLGAMADVWARVAQATEYDCAQGLITDASGGAPGSSVITASATASAGGTIPQGTLVSDPRGCLAVTTVGVPVPVGASTVTLHVITLRMTELVNTVDDPVWRFEPTSIVADATDASPIVVTTTRPHRLTTGQSVRVTGVLGNTSANTLAAVVVLTPTTFELTGTVGVAGYAGGGLVQLAPLGLSIDSSTPIQGGASDYLSAHGDERGVPRQAGEATYPYRLRVRNIPDAVSPVAVSLAVQGPAQAAQLDPVLVLESVDPMISPALATRYSLGVLNPIYASATLPASASPMTDFCDDPLRIILSTREARAYFELDPQTPVPQSAGITLFCDDGFCDDPVQGYVDLAAGPADISALMAIWQSADSKRAAGVSFDVVIPLPTDAVESGHAIPPPATPTVVLTMTPPTGKAWVLMDMVTSMDAQRSGTVPGGFDSHSVTFTFDDASTFTTFPFFQTYSQHLTLGTLVAAGYPAKPIVMIEGTVAQAGVLDLGLVVDARVIEYAT